MELPDYFPTMIAALVIVFMVLMLLFIVGYRIIDKLTPGDLNKELLGENHNKRPNVALAVVVGSMVLGTCLVLGLTAHGVLTH